MNVGTRVIVFAQHDTYRGRHGVVTSTSPHLMVLIDGERLPLAFFERDVIVEDPASGPMTAGG